MEEGPKITKPALQEVLGEDYELFEEGADIYVHTHIKKRPAPLSSMSPFEPGPWPDRDLGE